MPASQHDTLPAAPWVLLDEDTAEQAASLLERLTDWLTDPRDTTIARAAHALSLGETSDPDTIAGWTDALAARLRRRITDSQL